MTKANHRPEVGESRVLRSVRREALRYEGKRVTPPDFPAQGEDGCGYRARQERQPGDGHFAIRSQEAAGPVEKLLKSAVANASEFHGVTDVDDLVIEHIAVDEGPTIKRYTPRARGRATPIRKTDESRQAGAAERSN